MPGGLDIMPSPVEAWPEGSVKGLKARGNVTVDFSWKNGKVSNVKLYSDQPKVLPGARQRKDDPHENPAAETRVRKLRRLLPGKRRRFRTRFQLRQQNDHGFQLPLYGGWKFFIFPASLREETGVWFKKERKGTEMSTARRKDFFS